MHYVNQSVHSLSHYSTVESVYWQLHKKGVGSVVKHAFAITDKEGKEPRLAIWNYWLYSPIIELST